MATIAGVGTVPVVCKKLGRHFIGIEQNPEYVKIAEQRIKQAERKIQKDLLQYGT